MIKDDLFLKTQFGLVSIQNKIYLNISIAINTCIIIFGNI